MSEKRDLFNLELELPDGRDFISRAPKLSLEEYEAWCEEYWAAHERVQPVRRIRDVEAFEM